MDWDYWCTFLSFNVEKKPRKSIKIMASCLTSTHYDCTVDPLGRAGHWSEEEECIKKNAQLSKPFQFVHPCLVLMEFTYCNVKLGECAAVHWLPVSTVKSWQLHIYAFITTAPGTQISIFKIMSLCVLFSDCHTPTMFVPKIVGWEIRAKGQESISSLSMLNSVLVVSIGW